MRPRNDYLITTGAGAGNPSLWFDARKCTDATDVAVVQLTDRSGWSRHATQSNSTKRALMKRGSSPYDARDNYLLFDGSNDCYQTAAIDWTGTQALTIFAVYQSSQSGIGMVCEASADQGGRTDCFVVAHGNNVTAVPWAQSNGNVGAQARTVNATQSSKMCVCWRLDKSQSAANEMLCWINASPPAVTVNASAENTNSFGNQVLNVGARNNGTVYALQHKLYQLVIYPVRLTDAQTTLVDRVLRTISGIV